MHTMHLLPSAEIQPNLELKTRPKPVLGSLPLAFALPYGSPYFGRVLSYVRKMLMKLTTGLIVIKHFSLSMMVGLWH
jgi:hypothetical protein